MPPPPKKPVSKKRGKKDEAKEEEVVVEESPTIVPADQVKLTAKQLDEDVTRVITAGNPRLAHGLVSYSYPEREFKAVPASQDEGTIFHALLRSSSMLATGEEATTQKECASARARARDYTRTGLGWAGRRGRADARVCSFTRARAARRPPPRSLGPS